MVRYSKLLSKTVLNTQFGAELPKLWPKMWFSLIFPTWSNLVRMGKSGEGPSWRPFALIFLLMIFFDYFMMTQAKICEKWLGLGCSGGGPGLNFGSTLRHHMTTCPRRGMDGKTICVFSACGYAYHPYPAWDKVAWNISRKRVLLGGGPPPLQKCWQLLLHKM